MRKPNRQLSEAEGLAILKKATYGVLSLVTPEGEPYGIPINYAFAEQERALYMHCFVKGKKLDCIAANPQVSFVAVGEETIMPERFVTHYQSVIVKGLATLITDADVKREKLLFLCNSLVPASLERRDEVIRRQLAAVTIIRVAIETVTAKHNHDD